MIMKALGLLDIIAATALLLSSFIPQTFLIVVALYLTLKGLAFVFGGDLASIIDLGVALYAVLITFGVSSVYVTIPCAAYLYQKGIISMM